MILARPLRVFANIFKMKKGFCISFFRNDHKGEFENHDFELFCNENDIFHNFTWRKQFIKKFFGLVEDYPNLKNLNFLLGTGHSNV